MPATCPLTQSYTPKDCLSTAGVRSYIITPFANMLTSTVTANVVTAITKTATFKQYKQQPETATFSYTGDGTTANGTYAYDWEATFKTYGTELLDQVELELLMKNRLIIIAELEDGTYWMLGRDYGSNAINDKFEAGTTFNSFIGSTVVVKGRSKTKFLQVNQAIIAG